jgi:hypothetical protein
MFPEIPRDEDAWPLEGESGRLKRPLASAATEDRIDPPQANSMTMASSGWPSSLRETLPVSVGAPLNSALFRAVAASTLRDPVAAGLTAPAWKPCTAKESAAKTNNSLRIGRRVKPLSLDIISVSSGRFKGIQSADALRLVPSDAVRWQVFEYSL